MPRARFAAIILVLVGCKTAPQTAALATRAQDAGFAALRDRVVDHYFEHTPQRAVELGLHRYDGRLGDRSAAALEAARAQLHADAEALGRIDPAGLSPTARSERAALLNQLSATLFQIEAVRAPWRSPFYYLRDLNASAYVTREYAPAADRARALIAFAKNAHQVLADAEANLAAGPMPRPWLELGLIITGGAIEFVEKEVRPLFASLADAALSRDLDAALTQIATDLKHFRDFLAAHRETASKDFALGPELYLKGLAQIEGLEIDLASLQRVADEDTAHNLAALAEAARQIDPKKSVAEVVATINADTPAADEVIPLASRQADEARQFLKTHPIVSIPSEDVAEVRVSPPFMRINPAFLSSAGVFEEKPLPSFYYISPPDPSWPPEQQKSYLQPRTVLLFTTVHELWPGHFLQDRYLKKQPSRVLKSMCSYAATEGWAHYTEEMMWDAGFGGGDPRAHVGQLLSALMRDARFLAALGMHTKGMTVEEATKLFMDKAFLSLPSARQQAMRGTGDPYYSSYTLGKLMIRKLRDDWKAKLQREGKGASYSLLAFHETFLAQGCEAVPIVRAALGAPGASL